MLADPYCPHDIVREPGELGLRSETFETYFGRLHLVRPAGGRRSDTANVLLHGVGGSWRSWTPLLQEAARRRVAWGELVVVDLPGFGESQNVQPHLEAKRVGEELMRVVARAGYRAADVVGHSMGGFLALDLASRRPQGLRSIAVLSGAYYSIVETVQRPLRAFTRHPLETFSYLALTGVSRLGGLGARLTAGAHRLGLLPLALRGVIAQPQGLRPSVLQYLSECLNPTSFAHAARNGVGYDCSARWGRIEVPVWAGFGDQDGLVPLEDGARLRRDLPHARIATLRGAGHFGNVERPGQLVCELDAFYRRS